MKETRETDSSLPKGKEAMRTIGIMWSQLPEARKASYTQRAAKGRETYSKAPEQYNRAKKSAAKDGAAGAVAAPAAEAPKKKVRATESFFLFTPSMRVERQRFPNDFVHAEAKGQRGRWREEKGPTQRRTCLQIGSTLTLPARYSPVHLHTEEKEIKEE